MKIVSLTAENYRNIEKQKIEFSDGVNLIIGKNAQGKTNVIEAIYTFARGKSFRGVADKKLIKFGCDYYFIEAVYEDKRRIQSLSYRYSEKGKVKKKNGIEEEKASDMLGNFRAVLFCPEHLMIVKGAPAERREFLNVGIAQNDIIYLKDYSLYGKILENRNALIKNAQKTSHFNENEIKVFSNQIAEWAAKIYIKRKEYIKRLDKYVNEVMKDISSGKESASLLYLSDIEADTYEEAREKYRGVFSGSIRKEIAFGTTMFGPHRDDMEILINKISARTYASQGQQRSLSLALKIAEGEVSKEINGEYPVFLFDDVLSELDSDRQRYIMSNTGGKQIIISACEQNIYGYCEETMKSTKEDNSEKEDAINENNIFGNEKINVIEVDGGRYVSSYR